MSNLPNVTPQVNNNVNPSVNPLTKHFRQPSLYIKLTSGGKYWREGTLNLTATGEIPVYPMTTKDEISLRTPDALINGTSVVQVIQSCVPNIKDAWAMPSVDVDSTLIAVRIASYGPKMPVSSKCPKCNEEHEYDVDLNSALNNINMPDYNTPVLLDGLTITLRPLNYLQVSKSGGIMFEEEKLIATLANDELDEDTRKSLYDAHVAKMLDLNLDNVTAATESIQTEDGTLVTDPRFIKEYYANTEATVIRTVNDRIKQYADTVGIKPVDVTCTEPDCNTQFKINVEFDYASFFGKGF
jgi:hypothetical protein